MSNCNKYVGLCEQYKKDRMKTLIRKWGTEEIAEIEHEEGECPACVKANGIPVGGVVFMVNEETKKIHRVECVGAFLGMSTLICKFVTEDEIKKEFQEFEEKYGKTDNAR